MNRNFWLLRPIPHGTNHMQDFLNDNMVAIGYPVGKSLYGKNSSEIRDTLRKFNWIEGLGNVRIFVRLMKKGDIVIVPDDNKRDVYFAEITSDYIYEESVDKDEKGSGYPHQRNVEWLLDKRSFLRSDLSEELLSSLRYPGTVADITKHSSIISSILKLDNSQETETNSLEKEAKDVLRDILKSDNIEHRLRAAEIILTTGLI